MDLGARKKTINIFVTAFYGLTGAIFLAIGLSTLLVNTGLLPSAGRDALLQETEGDLDKLHILQEFGSRRASDGDRA